MMLPASPCSPTKGGVRDSRPGSMDGLKFLNRMKPVGGRRSVPDHFSSFGILLLSPGIPGIRLSNYTAELESPTSSA